MVEERTVVAVDVFGVCELPMTKVEPLGRRHGDLEVLVFLVEEAISMRRRKRSIMRTSGAVSALRASYCGI